MPHPTGRAFQVDFDLSEHRLDIVTVDGAHRSLPLEDRSVADFHRTVMSMLDELGLATPIWPVPVEIPGAIAFADDHTQLAADLRDRYPAQRGFSARSLWYMRLRRGVARPGDSADPSAESRLGPKPAPPRPPRHPCRTEWYARRALTDGWTHTVLTDRITARLHQREGAAPSRVCLLELPG